MKVLHIFLFLLLNLFQQSLFPCEVYEPVTLKPSDASREDKDFFSFRQKLDEAIRNRDVKFLETAVDRHVSFAFEQNGTGKKNFWKHWGLDKKPKESPIWKQLKETTELGFSYRDNIWAAPFLFQLTPDSIDVYTYSLVIGTSVNVRSEPSKKGKVLAQLSWEFVKLSYEEGKALGDGNAEGKDSCEWQQVCLSDGRMGYICKQYLRSPLDQRLGIEKKGTDWKIIFFVEGGD